MYNIRCLNKISETGLKLLTKNYAITESLDQAQGVLVRSASLHETEFPSSLEAIARAGAGVNNIPLDRCTEQGIVVFNTPGANANGVKELVIAGLLLSSRGIIEGNEWVKAHKDDPDLAKSVEKAKKAFAGTEIKGKKLGVIGLGAIGIMVANAANGNGMKVTGYDPYMSVYSALHLSTHVSVTESLEELLSDSDFVTIHVPLSPSTKGMIGKDAFAKMKDGVILLNFARDALVDEAALKEALEEGKVKTYVTDFPNPVSANLEHTICIPHLGASTEESEDNCAAMAVREMMDYLENGNIQNSVNFPACDMGRISGLNRVCVFHKNIPNMIGQFASVLANENINIVSMNNKSRNDIAYTLIDIEQEADEKITGQLAAIDGVFKIRVLKNKEAK